MPIHTGLFAHLLHLFRCETDFLGIFGSRVQVNFVSNKIMAYEEIRTLLHASQIDTYLEDVQLLAHRGRDERHIFRRQEVKIAYVQWTRRNVERGRLRVDIRRIVDMYDRALA